MPRNLELQQEGLARLLGEGGGTQGEEPFPCSPNWLKSSNAKIRGPLLAVDFQMSFQEQRPITEAARSHVRETVRQWLGVRKDDALHVPEMPDNLARLFLRCEEWEIDSRDQWGNFEHGLADNTRRRTLWIPEVDEWVNSIRATLPPKVQTEPLWPNGHKFALCLSHDVDAISTQYSALQLHRLKRRELLAKSVLTGADRSFLAAFESESSRLESLRPSERPSSAVESMDRSIQIEKDFGIKGSYFFPIWPPKVDSPYDCLYTADDQYTYLGRVMTARDIMLELAAEGFDVGLHGGYHTALSLENFLHEKHLIEDETGLSITTTRQHWLHWDARVTPRIQFQAGITADSTLGYNRNIGFRAGTSKPYFFYDVGTDEQLDLVELPMVLMDGSVFSTMALELDLPRAKQIAFDLIDRIIETGGCASLLFHPENLANPATYSLYRECTAYCIEKGAWGASLKQIENWWRDRTAKLNAQSPSTEH
ncbi:polysaccharide deacetylase family protein [Microvirga rosea]|uniref:polysaccharide deacetylase family protein n=1 Tax=Microvirga rosea TaxID=2715425 RepID=UPI001D0AB40C|nr:polysaccharide deacetylase family protein [Microvirga rosea]MCB8820156.1 polysaccharide deacetylase family protein [Microvirga rosea]